MNKNAMELKARFEAAEQEHPIFGKNGKKWIDPAKLTAEQKEVGLRGGMLRCIHETMYKVQEEIDKLDKTWRRNGTNENKKKLDDMWRVSLEIWRSGQSRCDRIDLAGKGSESFWEAAAEIETTLRQCVIADASGMTPIQLF